MLAIALQLLVCGFESSAAGSRVWKCWSSCWQLMLFLGGGKVAAAMEQWGAPLLFHIVRQRVYRAET